MCKRKGPDTEEVEMGRKEVTSTQVADIHCAGRVRECRIQVMYSKIIQISGMPLQWQRTDAISGSVETQGVYRPLAVSEEARLSVSVSGSSASRYNE